MSALAVIDSIFHLKVPPSMDLTRNWWDNELSHNGRITVLQQLSHSPDWALFKFDALPGLTRREIHEYNETHI